MTGCLRRRAFRSKQGSGGAFHTIDNLATTAINLTAIAVAISIGNAGSNILDGGGGGDLMVGFDGDEHLLHPQPSEPALETGARLSTVSSPERARA